MRLGSKQRLFARLLPRLIDKAHELGFEVTVGDAYRDPRVHGDVGEKIVKYGHPRSAHKIRLAIDLNLFKNREYITTTEGHRELGEWWVAQDELCMWGGNFSRPDGNHYSLYHEGIM